MPSPQKPPPPWPRWATLTLLALTCHATWLRSANLDPPSLWFDDLWVVLLTRAPDPASFFGLAGHCPPLFKLAVLSTTSLCSDPETSAQWAPFLASCLTIPLTAAAAFLLTRSPLSALWAAALLAYHPLAINFAARVKQYASDTALTALVIILAHRALTHPSPRSLYAATAALALGIWASTVSVFLAAALAPFLFAQLWTRPPLRHHLLRAALILTTSTLSLYLLVIRPASNDTLRAYWHAHYLPAGNLWDLAVAITRLTAQTLSGTFHTPPSLSLTTTLAAASLPLGLRFLWTHQRPLACAFASLPLGLVVCSLWEQYPLGTRVDQFTLPVLACTSASGLALLLTHLPPKLTPLAHLAILATITLHLPTPRRTTYPPHASAPLVSILAQRLQPHDTLLANKHSALALSYYGPWPSSFQPAPDSAIRFTVQPHLPNLHWYWYHPVSLPHPPSRLWFLSINDFPKRSPLVLQSLLDQGLVITETHHAQRSQLLLLTRP